METICNAQTRWNEHDNRNKNFNLAKNLKENSAHKFTLTVMTNASGSFHKRKTLEALKMLTHFQPNVAFHIETSHLSCRAKQA